MRFSFFRKKQEEPVKSGYYGQFKPPVDQFIFERYFINNPLEGRGTCLECGAFDGVAESSCFFFEESLGWKAINIEASPPIFQKLEKNRAKAINIHAALSDSDGIVDFVHAYHPVHGESFGNGSVHHAAHHKAELDAQGCTYKVYQVPKRRYSSLIAELSIKSLDLMVLDVEGTELSVLEGMGGCSVLPKIMCIEFGNAGLNVIDSALSKMEYTFDTISNANAFFIKR